MKRTSAYVVIIYALFILLLNWFMMNTEQEEIVKGQLSKHHRDTDYLRTVSCNQLKNSIPTNQVTLTELNIALYEECTGRVLERQGLDVYKNSVKTAREGFESYKLGYSSKIAITEKLFGMSEREFETDESGRYFMMNKDGGIRTRYRFTGEQRRAINKIFQGLTGIAFYTENLDAYQEPVTDQEPVTETNQSSD